MSKTIAEIVTFMQKNNLRLVTAESCTAGLIAATVADVEGAGQLLDCAFVTYSPEAKKRCLHVKQETLDNYNLTSEAVAAEMAMGALTESPANLAIANTGWLIVQIRKYPLAHSASLGLFATAIMVLAYIAKPHTLMGTVIVSANRVPITPYAASPTTQVLTATHPSNRTNFVGM